MTKPKITMTIELQSIANRELETYVLSVIEKIHIQKFFKEYCKATEKYMKNNNIKGEAKYTIDYGN